MIKIRKSTVNDITQLSELFKNTILTVNCKDYSESEVIDWASCGDSNERWNKLINELYFIVAENEENIITGFSSISETGYLHSMFVHKDYQNQGIASALYKEIENYAIQNNILKITSEVSITARPFFESKGFLVDEEQKRKAKNLYMTNYKMSKQLAKPLNELTNEELWQLFPIIITEHNDNWKSYYLVEKENLIKIIGKENIIRINHIGSTAIPGLLAKPTIDILIEIIKHSNIENIITEMENSGYIFSPQPQKPPPHLMFMKGYTPWGFKGQAFHVHIRYGGDWDELYFRDYLLSHPDTIKEYGKLKLQLQEKYKHDRDAYTNAKSEFIINITELAKKI